MEKRSDLDQLNILLVEDDTFNQRFMKRSLENLNASVQVVSNGKEAVNAVGLKNIDLILMDLQMPVMNGFEAIKIIKKELDLTIPIIALTGSEEAEDREKALELGCVQYLVKPLSGEQLLTSILQVLNEEGKSVIGSSTQENNSQQEAHYNLAKLEEISRGNKEFVVKMVQLLLTELPLSLVALEESINAKDYARLKAVAHKMKPSVQLMKMSIAETIQTIEEDAGAEKNKESLPKRVGEVVRIGRGVLDELQEKFG